MKCIRNACSVKRFGEISVNIIHFRDGLIFLVCEFGYFMVNNEENKATFLPILYEQIFLRKCHISTISYDSEIHKKLFVLGYYITVQ